MNAIRPTQQHLAFRTSLEGVLRQHASELDAIEMLALAAHMVGQIVAMQDQRRYTPAQVMELVANNIELGNRSVIDNLMSQTGGTA